MVKLRNRIYNKQKLDAIGTLSIGIAQDFNNILSGIYGYIDLALKKSNETKVIEYLEKSIYSLDKTRELTEKLLKFSIYGKPIVKSLSIIPIIKETVGLTLSSSKISVEYNIKPDIWNCMVDKQQISQVIENLMTNAIQSMPKGGVIIVSVENIPQIEEILPGLYGRYVKFSIRDFGIGISQENLSKIFEPFFTTKPNCHGLGLTTCNSIINRHNGEIKVVSIPNRGTVFNVYLPATIDS